MPNIIEHHDMHLYRIEQEGYAAGSFVISSFIDENNIEEENNDDAALPVRICILPDVASVSCEDTLVFKAIAHYSNQHARDITQQVTWISSCMDVAEFKYSSDKGMLSTMDQGITSVTARLGKLTSNAAAINVVERRTDLAVIEPVSAPQSVDTNEPPINKLE